jgi:hypothetical protein
MRKPMFPAFFLLLVPLECLQNFHRTAVNGLRQLPSKSGHTGPDHPENPSFIPKREIDNRKDGTYDLIAKAREIRVLFGPDRSN